jgi:hypothetical protein
VWSVTTGHQQHTLEVTELHTPVPLAAVVHSGLHARVLLKPTHCNIFFLMVLFLQQEADSWVSRLPCGGSHTHPMLPNSSLG